MARLSWWHKCNCGVKFLLTFLSVFGAWTAWWWIDSARTCDRQAPDALHGFCLMQVRERAGQGDAAARQAYARYLEAHGGRGPDSVQADGR